MLHEMYTGYELWFLSLVNFVKFSSVPLRPRFRNFLISFFLFFFGWTLFHRVRRVSREFRFVSDQREVERYVQFCGQRGLLNNVSACCPIKSALFAGLAPTQGFLRLKFRRVYYCVVRYGLN